MDDLVALFEETLKDHRPAEKGERFRKGAWWAWIECSCGKTVEALDSLVYAQPMYRRHVAEVLAERIGAEAVPEVAIIVGQDEFGAEDWLEEARARCDAATEGPWEWRALEDESVREMVALIPHVLDKRYRGGYRYPTITVLDGGFNDWDACGVGATEPDADFIAHARTDLPKALDLIEELQGQNEALYQQWLDVQDADNTWERYGISCHHKWLAQRAEIAELVTALRTVTDELAQWGWDDFRYGEMPQKQRVVVPVAMARELLARYPKVTQ
jgi:hypothetical protein